MAITADNASPNDKMLDVLRELLVDFPGEANRGRCFDHVVNLCAKSILQLFDVTTKKAGVVMDDAERVLQELAEGLEVDDIVPGLEDNDDAGEDDDDLDGYVDEYGALDDLEKNDLDQDVYPVKKVLLKVSNPMKTEFTYPLC